MEIGLAYPTKEAERDVAYLEDFLEKYINGEDLPTVGDFGNNLSAESFLNLFHGCAENPDDKYSDPVLLPFKEIYTQITRLDEQIRTTYRLEKPKKPSKVAILPNRIKRGMESLKDRIPDAERLVEKIMEKIGGYEVKVDADDNHLVKFFLDISHDTDNVV
ncbi:MAG: hypothetical protein U9Q92_06675 [archaeon]|nr:hypothetical protein [archaeon]